MAIVPSSMRAPRRSRSPYLIAAVRQYPLPLHESTSCRSGCHRLFVASKTSTRRTFAGWSGSSPRLAQPLLHDVRGEHPGDRFRRFGRSHGTVVFAAPIRCTLAGCLHRDRGRPALVCVAHPAAGVDGLPRHENGARGAVRQPDAKPPARRALRLDADPGWSRPSRGGLDAVDPRHPVTVAVNDDSVECCGERRRTTFGPGSGLPFDRAGDRLCGRSGAEGLAQPIEFDALLGTGEEPSDTRLRVRIGDRSEERKSAREHAGQDASASLASSRR